MFKVSSHPEHAQGDVVTFDLAAIIGHKDRVNGPEDRDLVQKSSESRNPTKSQIYIYIYEFI